MIQDTMELIAGVDEAGRGPLAGPVIAAAVILDPQRPIDGLADSKKLSERQRERLYDEILEKALAWSTGRAEVAEIDRVNILQASLLAMSRERHSRPTTSPRLLRLEMPLMSTPMSFPRAIISSTLTGYSQSTIKKG